MVNKRILYLIFIIISHYYLSFYLKSKINNYYNARINFIHSLNKTYNESNLLTLEDKLNWLAIHSSEKEINIKQLPNQFVLKANHGSGFNIIVENKTEFNLTQAKTLLMNWLNIDYGKIGTEFHYSFINKKILVEEYIGSSLKNYKFLCYNGKPKFVYVSIKEGENKYRNFYDMNWKFLISNIIENIVP